jgi:hypothetical protein
MFMARREQSRGKCSYCGRELTGSGMTRHLSACAQLRQAVSAADQKPGGDQDIFHLRVRDAYSSDFWLHLEIESSATLADLDDYLRAIWLECCGHMSQFSFGGWRGEEIPMGTKTGQVLEPGYELTHIYDFGTSSETLVKPVGVRTGKPLTRHPITLMARNNMPEVECIECGRPASRLCVECIYEHGEAGTLCDRHASVHKHEEYGDPVRLLNSPRVGLCGYTGPAEPPY